MFPLPFLYKKKAGKEVDPAHLIQTTFTESEREREREIIQAQQTPNSNQRKKKKRMKSRRKETRNGDHKLKAISQLNMKKRRQGQLEIIYLSR